MKSPKGTDPKRLPPMISPTISSSKYRGKARMHSQRGEKSPGILCAARIKIQPNSPDIAEYP
jgi:hypothetical protein